MRIVLTALTLAALVLAGCSQDNELKESPEQAAKEQAVADAHNASTVPSPGDDETPLSSEASATTTTAVPEYGGFELLRVGQCVDQPTEHTPSVRAVACDRPHHAEVTSVVDIGSRFPNGAPTPDDYQRILETDCQQAFDGYLRRPPPQGVSPGIVDPTPETWYLGQHHVLCTAEANAEGNVLTGSVRRAT